MLKLTASCILIMAFFLSGCKAISTNNNYERITLQTTNLPNGKVQFDKVLVVGTGLTPSRVFLDNLYPEINRSLQQKGISSEFEYIGKIDNSKPLKLARIKPGFDAYLVFRASDSAALNTRITTYAIPTPMSVIPAVGLSASTYAHRFTEKYTVAVFTNKSNIDPAWQGVLDINLDLAQNHKYKTISTLLCKELERNGIITKGR